MKRPIIGISCNILPASHWTVDMGIAAPNQDFLGAATDYIDMIVRSGGTPLFLPTIADLDAAAELWERLDGMLISGGNDVDPALYHERIDTKCGAIDLPRDRYEAAALRFALQHDMPVLGICRGIQLFNAVLGGTNYQDLLDAGFKQHTILSYPRNAVSHTVDIEKDGLLYEIFGKTELGVNSFHHQAVKDPAPGFKVLARSSDGVIEAAQVEGQSFALAVQWHPEMMYDSDEQLKIAKAFVSACDQARKEQTYV